MYPLDHGVACVQILSLPWFQAPSNLIDSLLPIRKIEAEELQTSLPGFWHYICPLFPRYLRTRGPHETHEGPSRMSSAGQLRMRIWSMEGLIWYFTARGPG